MSIRVLVVDDSALIREVLTRTLGRDGDIEVIGVASDPIEAREKIKSLNPDVVTLDIEMPNMNGLAFLDKLMRLRPLPVVMVSTLTTKGANETLLALELGAVDFVAKPSADLSGGIEAFGLDLREKVRAASHSRVAALSQQRAPSAKVVSVRGPDGALIAIGASTGGVDAVRAVLAPLPTDGPPIVVAQHMPPGFTKRFAARLDELCEVSVTEAEDRMPLLRGHAYVAPGDKHLRIERGSRGSFRARLGDDGAISGHRPSVDALFQSVALAAGPTAIGVILTGMGRDGATGLKRMRDAGAYTIGQSQASALVYGMPRVAFEEDAVMEQAAVEAIPGRLAAVLGRLQSAA
jgi:two-component system, chemotaxis family, protein-glutamate methylesterase/glutaminase